MLRYLCDTYNILHEQTTFAEKYYCEQATQVVQCEHDVAKAFQILEKVRFYLEESIRYAHQEVKTRPNCSASMLYIPKEYRQQGNSIYYYISLVC
jgi:hypothetical protein